MLGIWRLFETLNDYTLATRYGVPAAVGLACGWFIFRLVQYPPFVEFLIATEAEMNKVSWTSREDLYRATTVVLVTVILMALFLFAVDWLWSYLLQMLGVLKFGGGGAFGLGAAADEAARVPGVAASAPASRGSERHSVRCPEVATRPPRFSRRHTLARRRPKSREFDANLTKSC